MTPALAFLLGVAVMIVLALAAVGCITIATAWSDAKSRASPLLVKPEDCMIHHAVFVPAEGRYRCVLCGARFPHDPSPIGQQGPQDA